MNKKEYIPEICVWELTHKCNMRCIHCGASASNGRRNELALDECLKVADDLLKLGCRKVTLIGGEVFLYEGWEKVARSLSDKGAIVNIITNAFILGNEQLEQIKYAQLANVGLSIDGTEKNHNRIRNNNTSFQRVLDALLLLQQQDIPTAVVTTLLDFNVSDLDTLYDILLKHHVTVWQFQVANLMGTMKKNQKYMMKYEKIPFITEFIKQKRNEGKIRVYAADNIGYYDENEMHLRNRPGTISVWQGCKAGINVIGIDSVGNVKGCESLYSDIFIEGNVRTEPLSIIWNKKGNFAYNRDFDPTKLKGKCAICDKSFLCRAGCRASCYFTTGSLFENGYCSYAIPITK